MRYYIDVILPIPIEKLFTYEVSENEADYLKQGMRVAVPFGKKKIYTALVFRIHNEPPSLYEAKPIDQLLDEAPIVSPTQLEHWLWIADYYMCTIGDVFKAAVPSAFLLESETIITKNDKFSLPETALKDDEWLVYEALQHQPVLKVQEVSQIIDRKNVFPVLNRLLDKQVLNLKEEVYEQYKPKLVRYIRLASPYTSEDRLQVLLNELNRAPKQKEVVLNLFTLEAATRKPIKVKELEEKAKVSSGVVKTLIDKEVLQEYHLQVDRVQYAGHETKASKVLNEFQMEALKQIDENYKKHQVTLLHGVTSSGKTEVYVKLIERMIAQGKQVLYLLPEIALTTQLIHRLQNYFGNKVSVYHSKYSVNERVEVWNHIMENNTKAQIVLGARSSVLLPFTNLGLVIVDEEHETSFKQFDPAPRYHARDAAIVLAMMHKARVLLGSATPSVESYYNAKLGKYGFVELNRRFGNALMPEMELVDIKEKHKKKRMNGHFSDRLIKEIEEVLSEGEQVILFQNRRGFAPIIECETCGHSAQCPNCDVSLTYHRYKKQLRCHYCGYHIAEQRSCLSCGSSELNTKGFGTEQVEVELKSLFPNANIARMDSDTTKGKYGYEKIITAFEQHEIDILVGTQMLTKGLDFRNVTLVGIMNADNLLNHPDFRAHERSFQLIQQVAGRAGRTRKRGKVIVQTYNPYHQILQQASMHKFLDMFTDQINERKQYKYPPFYRLIKLTFKNRDYQKLHEGTNWFSTSLKNSFGSNVLGPEQPPVGRIRNEYILNVLVKIPPKRSIKEVKTTIRKIKKSFEAIPQYKAIRIILNVDNY
ncbi:replication restart helicase PriA [Zhouia amylolytica]|uniref:replication restart helicase PriA n=1 Tax=Zhouia amylolytica TaxID=376730 RepID=UPI0020CD0404|nr:primosomal protein N' [Zhouia amylolytica]MCQ0111958.1 primosomal protein N' [Zhouia amylolytica]